MSNKNNLSEVTKRIDWIDVVKGLGILLVILGHAPRDIMREKFFIIDLVYQIIYSFHMGLFFAVSGYIYVQTKKENQSMLQYIKKLFVRLIIPWFVYSMIIYLIFYLANLIPAINGLFKGTSQEIMSITKYITYMFKADNPYAFHLWYIYYLFLIQVIYHISNKIITFKHKNIVLIFISYFVKCIVPYSVVKMLLIDFIYYILGTEFSKIKIKIKMPELLLVLGIIMNICYVYISPAINTNLIYIFNIVKELISTPLIIYTVFEISKKLTKCHPLIYFGKNSYNIYLLHQPFFCGFLGLLFTKIMPLNLANCGLIIIICSIASMIVPLFILFIINKLKLNKLFKKTLNLQYIPYNN